MDSTFTLFNYLRKYRPHWHLFRYLGNIIVPPQFIRNFKAKQLDSRHNVSCFLIDNHWRKGGMGASKRYPPFSLQFFSLSRRQVQRAQYRLHISRDPCCWHLHHLFWEWISTDPVWFPRGTLAGLYHSILTNNVARNWPSVYGVKEVDNHVGYICVMTRDVSFVAGITW